MTRWRSRSAPPFPTNKVKSRAPSGSNRFLMQSSSSCPCTKHMWAYFNHTPALLGALELPTDNFSAAQPFVDPRKSSVWNVDNFMTADEAVLAMECGEVELEPKTTSKYSSVLPILILFAAEICLFSGFFVSVQVFVDDRRN